MRTRFAVIVGLFLISAVVLAQGRDPFAGAWEALDGKNLTTGQVVPAPNPALHVIAANGQYVQFAAGANRQKVTTAVADMTRDQLADRYRGVQGQYGTYRIAGSKITRHIVSAANPNNEGRDDMADFKIDKGILIVTAANAQGQMIETRYRRLSSGS
jgi:hypothetical protein